MKGLQDWQSGGHEWHVRSSRYMNSAAARQQTSTGLGRRARQFAYVPFEPVGHLVVPPLYMPFEFRTSPYLPAAREHVLGWARSMGMLDEGIWDERRFRGFDFAHCAAMIDAGGTAEAVDLTSDWLAWGTYADDLYPQLDLLRARAQHERLRMLLSDQPPEPVNALERGLADVWRRTSLSLSAGSRARMRAAVLDMTESWLWELGNRMVNRIPDPIDYVEMRRDTFGSDLTILAGRLAADDPVPDEIYQSRVVREMVTAAQDYACFTNDLHSYQKEIQFDGELHNMVLVVQRFLDVDRWTAADIVARLMRERMEQFEMLVETGLPRLFDEYDLSAEARDELIRQADLLKDWMAGVLEWHRRTPRYTDAELRRTHYGFTLLPTGLGTAAARLLPAGAWSEGAASEGAGLPGRSRSSGRRAG